MTEVAAANSRGLIRSMLVIGSTQVVNIAISILRLKILAILLGPTGIGLLSIYNNLQGMVSQAAGLGMASSGVREIASAREDTETLARVRKVLLGAHFIQGSLALVCVWFFRVQIAEWLFDDAEFATAVGLTGFAVLLALLASAHTALLQGLRRIGDLGRVTVIGAVFGTLAGLTAVWFFGLAGLIWFVLVQPLANLLTAIYFVRKLPKTDPRPLSGTEVWQTWVPMARLGMAFMLGGLVTAATLLLVRGHISSTLGLEAAGFFAAAWGITMTYVGFLLGAMSADYYPRLTEVIKDKRAAGALMNDQAQLGLAIGGPVLLLLIGWAPWAITLLYSDDFGPAVTLLQWQSVGNVFKLASWPMSFSIVAAARAKTFFFMEMSFNVVFLALIFALLPTVGLTITATAFLVGYIVYFLTVFILVRRIHNFRPEPLSIRLFALHAGLSSALLALSLFAPALALWVAPVLAVSTGLVGLRTVLAKIGPQGRLPARLFAMFKATGWPIPETS